MMNLPNDPLFLTHTKRIGYVVPDWEHTQQQTYFIEEYKNYISQIAISYFNFQNTSYEKITETLAKYNFPIDIKPVPLQKMYEILPDKDSLDVCAFGELGQKVHIFMNTDHNHTPCLYVMEPPSKVEHTSCDWC
jgi:hypothetical protein